MAKDVDQVNEQRRRLVRVVASMNKRARSAGVYGEVTWQQLMDLGNVCRYCGIEVEPMHGSYDHVTAIDRDGPNVVGNIVRCCMTCQRSKHTKSMSEFAEARSIEVECALPGCGKRWRPRYGEWRRGMSKYCSLSHAARSRWVRRDGHE